MSEITKRAKVWDGANWVPVADLLASNETLRAEVERLRAALQRIAADDEADADLNEWGAAAIARAALEEGRT